MTTEALLAQVNTIFKDILDLPDLVLRPEMTAKEVPEWDSLSHIQLVVAVEKHFKIKFAAREIQSFKNVGDLLNAIASKYLA